MPIKTVPSKLATALKTWRVQHEVVPHRTVFTAYDLAQTLRVRLEEIAKTLLVKAGKQYHLVVLRASDRLDLKKLGKLLGANSVSIAREGDMVKTMKVKPGAITPFGSLHGLSVVMERGLLKTKQALFGSGSFEHAVKMSVKDYVKHEQPTVGSFGVGAKLRLQAKPKAAPRPNAKKKKKARR